MADRSSDPKTPATEADTEAVLPPIADEGEVPLSADERLEDLVRVLKQVMRGDFSERPRWTEEEDTVGELEVLLRFLIEDLQRAHEVRDREVERLRAVDRIKSEFINNAAHELNTPLTPIRMQLHILRENLEKAGTLDEKQGKALTIMGRNVERVHLLVEDLLMTSRLESGQFKLDKGPLDLHQVLSQSAESFAEAARQRGIRLRARGDLGLMVHGDAVRLGQVVDNLVRNALKFTPEGGTVEVRLRRRDEEALVEVVDTGIGLDADEIAQLFKPFAKLADQSPHGDPGTGLGLYIAKGLVERHGGLLWCESPGKGEGATFAFALPLMGDVDASTGS